MKYYFRVAHVHFPWKKQSSLKLMLLISCNCKEYFNRKLFFLKLKLIVWKYNKYARNENRFISCTVCIFNYIFPMFSHTKTSTIALFRRANISKNHNRYTHIFKVNLSSVNLRNIKEFRNSTGSYTATSIYAKLTDLYSIFSALT